MSVERWRVSQWRDSFVTYAQFLHWYCTGRKVTWEVADA